MKGTTLHLDRLGGRLVAASLVDGRLDDLLVAPGGDVPLPGALYRAVVERPLKGQGGAMVRLPGGAGFLRDARGVRPGQALVVQVAGFAEEGKAVPLRSAPVLKSRHVIVTPGRPGINLSRRIRGGADRERLGGLAQRVAGDPGETGLILRSAAAAAPEEEIAREAAALLGLAARIARDEGGDPALLVPGPDPHELARRDWPMPDETFADPGNFADHGIDAMVARLSEGRVDLPEGHWFSVEPTRALVAIDVNTGADSSQAAGLKANLACARQLPSALRCRGLGGQVVIDMAPAPKARRRAIDQALTAAFRTDSVETVVVGWTRLGHVELQRRRDRLPLHQLLET